MTFYTPPRVKKIMTEWREIFTKEAKKLITPLKKWFEMKYDLTTVGNGGVATSITTRDMISNTRPINPIEPNQSNSKKPHIDKEFKKTITDIDMTPPTQEHTKEVRKNTKNMYRRGARKAIREHLHRKYGGTHKEAKAMAEKFVAAEVIWDAWNPSLEYWVQMEAVCKLIDGVVNSCDEWMYVPKKKKK